MGDTRPRVFPHTPIRSRADPLITRLLSAADLIREHVRHEADAASRRGYFQKPSPHPEDHTDIEAAADTGIEAPEVRALLG